MNYTADNAPLISVILPVYNVQKYLCRCLNSVIQQSYKFLEIILVDDGSTDCSGKICDIYEKRDCRIKVFHKENGGLSDARNYGISKANGEFLTFVDSDDYIDEDYVEYLYGLIKGTACKMSICSLYVCYTAGGRIRGMGNGKRGVLTGKKCIEMMCYHREVDTAACAKLYHRTLFDEVRFPKGKLFEDIGTLYLLFDQCNYIAYGFEPKYYYMVRNDSIVTSAFHMQKLDLIEMTDAMGDYVDRKYPDLQPATLRRRAYARFSTLNQMIDVENIHDIRDGIITYLNEVCAAVIKNPQTPARDKLAFYLLKTGYPLYSCFWKIYVKMQRR